MDIGRDSSAPKTSNDASPVAAALKNCRSAFWSVAVFSAGVNVMMLAGPLYMLQIYDRVLASRSVPTLIALSLLLVGAYAFQGVLDVIRNRLVVRVASLVDHDLEATVHGAVVRLAQRPAPNGERSSPVRDLDQIRSFMTSNGPIAIVDLPWIPVFLVVCYLIYPWLGLIALGGALLMFAIAVQTERASHEPSRTMAQENGARLAMIETDRRNNETITAMGMLPSLTQRWSAVNQRYLGANERASDLVGSYGSISKVLRLLLQSAMLGTGAYLVIQGEMTAGAMIAASIMMGRAVAPIETAIANWRGFIAARESIARLSQALARLGGASELTPLPAPRHHLEVTDVSVTAPNGADRDRFGSDISRSRLATPCACSARAEPARPRSAAPWSASGSRRREPSVSTARRSTNGPPRRSGRISDLSRRRSNCSTAPSPRISRAWTAARIRRRSSRPPVPPAPTT